ncbi:MAG TPA: HAD family hydrolase [Thermoplasmata archaeon]|nr:HAD family hydrolase [Thermoplasmata archaeon]
MPRSRSRPNDDPPAEPHRTAPAEESTPPPFTGNLSTSQFAEKVQAVFREEPVVAPSKLARGLVLFDLDGTLLDDVGLIADVAGDVLWKAFGTPAPEGRLHYLATTGMPFEAQLSQLYPAAPDELRSQTARIFHQRKVTEAYAVAGIFPEIPKVLKRLSSAGWTMAVSTGAEREMADLVLEREGLRYWFEDVLGSAQGTKREHLGEFARRYPGARTFLVGDSRFDMEAASSAPGVVAIGRASSLLGWTLTPDDLKRWGAVWADYSLSGLPDFLEGAPPPGRTVPSRRRKR